LPAGPALDSQNVLERVHVQVGLSQQPLEHAVPGFDFKHALRFGYLHVAELGRHLYKVALLTPPQRHRSLIGMPASARSRKPLCASRNLLDCMSVIPQRG